MIAASFVSTIELMKSGYSPGQRQVGLIFLTLAGLKSDDFARWWSAVQCVLTWVFAVWCKALVIGCVVGQVDRWA